MGQGDGRRKMERRGRMVEGARPINRRIFICPAAFPMTETVYTSLAVVE
jgi:hypothetical protein